jgi:sugar phosphate permease
MEYYGMGLFDATGVPPCKYEAAAWRYSTTRGDRLATTGCEEGIGGFEVVRRIAAG